MTDHQAKSRLNGHIAGSLLFLGLAFAGWGAFLYTLRSTADLRSEMSSQISRLDADRDQIVAERDRWRTAHDQLQGVDRELTATRAQLESARSEIAALTRAQEQTRADLEAAKQEAASLTEQLDQANAQTAQTGATTRSTRKPIRRRSARSSR